MRSEFVKIGIMVGLLGAFGGIALIKDFFVARPESRIEVIVNNRKSSAIEKVRLIVGQKSLLEELGDPTGSLQLYQLGIACFAKGRSLRASNPKEADHLERAGGHFISAACELQRPSKEKAPKVAGALLQAFEELEHVDEPVKLPVSYEPSHSGPPCKDFSTGFGY